MTLLTKQFLADLGIELEESDYETLSEHFDTTLDERVINEIVDALTPEQAEQLAAMQNSEGDDIYAWLKINVPDLTDIISDEVNILLGELAENSQKL